MQQKENWKSNAAKGQAKLLIHSLELFKTQPDINVKTEDLAKEQELTQNLHPLFATNSTQWE